jgi:hypothetical protein
MEAPWLDGALTPRNPEVHDVDRFAGMATRSSGSEFTKIGIGQDDDDMRYRLDVIAPSVLDVVESAGGWLFDRRMVGRDVTVMVPGEEDPLPVQILGAEILPFEPTSNPWQQRPHPQGLAVASDLFDRDPRVKQSVFHVLEQGLPDVILWGRDWPEGLVRSDGEIRHELSRAARAFKYHAVRAALGHEPASVGGTETLQSGAIAPPSPLVRRRRQRGRLHHGQTA